jgi:hypothetical protein
MRRFIDLGTEVARLGGELRGGEINFLGDVHRHARYPDGRRYVFFTISDNYDAPEDRTMLAVATHQRMRELKPIFNFPHPVGDENALISVAVERIGKPVDLLMDKSGTLFVCPVFGTLTLRAVDGDDAEERIKEHERRVKWIAAPTNAWANYSYDAAGNVVHVHFICRNEDETFTTATEKARRIAALMAQPTAPPATRPRDGNQRMFSLTRLP